MARLRVLIVEDHAVVREGLKVILEGQGLEVVGHTGSGDEAVTLAQSLAPDVVLLDIGIPDLNGIEVARRIRGQQSAARIVALTAHSDPDFAYRFLEAGGDGYWVKDASASALVDAIQRVAGGEEVLAPCVAPGVENRRAQARGLPEPDALLTYRETQVLQLVCRGYSSKQIAKMLRISVRTIEQHRAHIMEKSGASNIAALVTWATAQKLVTLQD